MTGFLVDGLTRTGYQPVRHPVSALALGPRGWVQTLNFVVSGLLITAAAPGLHHRTGSLWLAVTVAVFGLSLVASAMFPMVGALDPIVPANLRWLAGYRHPRHGIPVVGSGAYGVAFAEPVPLLAGAEAVGGAIAVLPVLFHLLWRLELATGQCRCTRPRPLPLPLTAWLRPDARAGAGGAAPR